MFAVAEVQMEISLVNKTRGELFKQRGEWGRSTAWHVCCGLDSGNDAQTANGRQPEIAFACSPFEVLFHVQQKRREEEEEEDRQQFTFFRWGHYVRAPDAGADAPLQL